MIKELDAIKACNWSLNLEDTYYDDHREELLDEAVKAVVHTGEGFFVNVVTPAGCGDPREWLFAQLTEELARLAINYKSLLYVDECGCGGFVSRVYR